MLRIPILMAILSLTALLSDCGGPVITVNNNTGFGVRVTVHSSAGSDVVSPSPGESSTVDAVEGGFTATAINDADWINYAKTYRKLLNDQLANSDQLSGPQLLALVQRLKDIAKNMKNFEAAAGSGGTCAGAVTQDKDGAVTVSLAADGSLAASCGSS